MAGKVGRPPGGKKYGGRKKGTPNKNTSEVRKILMDLFNKLVVSFDDVNALEDKEKIALFGKILPYICTQKQPEPEQTQIEAPKQVFKINGQNITF